MAAAFSMTVLTGSHAGDTYTLSEYERMFRSVGFAKTKLHPAPDMPRQVLLSEK